MFPHHHVIEEDNDEMEWQSEGEDIGTYSATGMAIFRINRSIIYRY
jgi:hypothetical protein